MQYGIMGRWAVLAFALLAVAGSSGAQELLPIATEPKGATTPETAPPPVVDTEAIAVGEGHEGEHGKCFVVGEYFLLQPRRRGQDFVIIDPNTDGAPQGSIESLFWESNSGVRVGGGYQFPDHWDAGIYYTYFWAGNERSVFAPPGGTLYATLGHAGFTDAVDNAVGTSSLRYQVLDVELGKRIEVGESLGVWVGGGGRFAWIEQGLQVTYNGQTAYLANVNSPITFDGGGLRVGAKGDWKLGRSGLGLYGRAFGSLLGGNFHTHLFETLNNGSQVTTGVEEHFRKVVPVAEIGMGLFWQRENWRALVGYEFINWFGMVDSPDFISDYTNKLNYRTSDLTLDGLRIGLQLDY